MKDCFTKGTPDMSDHTMQSKDSSRSNSICYLEYEHWPGVRAIYEEGLSRGDATFETSAPEWGEWDRDHLSCCRLVAVAGSDVAGWAALGPVSERCIYAGVAEVSVYVAEDYQRRGLGKELLDALIKESEPAGIWTLQAGIFPENEASMALHRACDFRIVGYRERIGQLDGVWRDVILLERRSPSIQ
jgi:phosphinothricin acetyltransferase